METQIELLKSTRIQESRIRELTTELIGKTNEKHFDKVSELFEEQ